MQINVSVTDANNIVCEVVPPQQQIVVIDRGVEGNGIVSIVPVTISTFQYLRITYTNGTVQDVGPLTSTAYTATSPITIVGNTISLTTVPIALGGTDATTAAGAIQNLLPSYTGNANKRLGLNSGGTALEWVADGGGTVTSVSGTGSVNGLTLTGTVTSSGSLTLGGTLSNVANSALTNSAITINGTSTSLGGSINVGTVTSIAASGGTTGLTFSGSPITTSGTLTLGGTLAIANGGTGQTTANAALNALLPTQTGNSSKYLQTDGTNATWDAISLSTADITGILPTANGGTGLSSFTANGVVYASSTSALTTGSALTFNGNELTVNGSSRVNLGATTSAFKVAGFASGSANTILQSDASTGVAYWISAKTSGILSIGGNGGTEPSAGAINITTTGNVGIGLTNPTLPLTLTKNGTQVGATNAYLTAAFRDGSNNKGVSLGYDNSAQIGVVFGDSNSAPSGIAFWSYNSDGTGWAETARFTTDRKLTLGTNATNGKFTVYNGVVGGLATTLTPIQTNWMQYAAGVGDNRGSGPSFVLSQGLTPDALIKSAAIGAPSEDSGGLARNIGLSFWTSAFDANRVEVGRFTGNGGNFLVGNTTGYGVGETNTIQAKGSIVWAANNTANANNRNWLMSVNGFQNGSFDTVISSTNTGWANAAYMTSVLRTGDLYVHQGDVIAANGTARTSIMFRAYEVGAGGNNGGFSMGTSGAKGSIWGASGNVGLYIVGGSNVINFGGSSGDTSLFANYSSLGIWNSTGLGIGTTNPATRLHVESASATTNTKVVSPLSGSLFYSGFEVARTTVSGGALMRSARNASIGGVGWEWLTTADNAAEISGTYTSRMNLDNTGNLGLGGGTTAYNNARLTVVTTATATRQNLASIDKTTANWVRFTNPQFSTDSSMGLILKSFPDSDARQGAGIIASGGTTNNSTNLSLFVTGSDAVSFAAYTAAPSGANIDHTWNRSAGSAAMILNASGRLGIGTTNPLTSFVVSNSGIGGLEINPSGGVGNGPYIQAFDRFSSNTQALSFYAASYTFSVGASGGTRAVDIDSSGNFLIGASSTRASSKLDIRGDVMTLGSNATYYATIDYNAGSGLLSLASETGGGVRFLSGTSEKGRFVGNNFMVGTTNTSGTIGNDIGEITGRTKTASGTFIPPSNGTWNDITTIANPGLYILHAYIAGYNAGTADWSNAWMITYTGGNNPFVAPMLGATGNVQCRTKTGATTTLQIFAAAGAGIEYTWAILRIA